MLLGLNTWFQYIVYCLALIAVQWLLSDEYNLVLHQEQEYRSRNFIVF